jgi:hypothetical protein
MATRDVTCVRGPPPCCACVRVLCCAVLCRAVLPNLVLGMRLTCLAVLGACVFPPSSRADAVYVCHVIVLDPALPPIGPSRRYIKRYPSKTHLSCPGLRFDIPEKQIRVFLSADETVCETCQARVPANQWSPGGYMHRPSFLGGLGTWSRRPSSSSDSLAYHIGRHIYSSR